MDASLCTTQQSLAAGSVPIRAPITIDDDCDDDGIGLGRPTIDIRGSSAGFNSGGSNRGSSVDGECENEEEYECEGSVGEDDCETARERVFVSGSAEEFWEGRFYHGKDRFLRASVVAPDDETKEEHGKFREDWSFRTSGSDNEENSGVRIVGPSVADPDGKSIGSGLEETCSDDDEYSSMAGTMVVEDHVLSLSGFVPIARLTVDSEDEEQLVFEEAEDEVMAGVKIPALQELEENNGAPRVKAVNLYGGDENGLLDLSESSSCGLPKFSDLIAGNNSLTDYVADGDYCSSGARDWEHLARNSSFSEMDENGGFEDCSSQSDSINTDFDSEKLFKHRPNYVTEESLSCPNDKETKIDVIDMANSMTELKSHWQSGFDDPELFAVLEHLDKESMTDEKLQTLMVDNVGTMNGLGHRFADSMVAQILHRLSKTGNGLSNQASFNILVIGKAGVGKSATINSIMGERKTAVDAFESATTDVQEILQTISGITIRFLDTPGLQSSGMEQTVNRRILSSIRVFAEKFTPDFVLYIDRLDTNTRFLDEMPILQLVTDHLGPSIWKNVGILLTHANSTPPDGPDGLPLSCEVLVAKKTNVIRKCISMAIGDSCFLNSRAMHPVTLIENNPCQQNGNEEEDKSLATASVPLPNTTVPRQKQSCLAGGGREFEDDLLLLSYSLKDKGKPSPMVNLRSQFSVELGIHFFANILLNDMHSSKITLKISAWGFLPLAVLLFRTFLSGLGSKKL